MVPGSRTSAAGYLHAHFAVLCGGPVFGNSEYLSRGRFAWCPPKHGVRVPAYCASVGDHRSCNCARLGGDYGSQALPPGSRSEPDRTADEPCQLKCSPVSPSLFRMAQIPSTRFAQFLNMSVRSNFRTATRSAFLSTALLRK